MKSKKENINNLKSFFYVCIKVIKQIVCITEWKQNKKRLLYYFCQPNFNSLHRHNIVLYLLVKTYKYETPYIIMWKVSN